MIFFNGRWGGASLGLILTPIFSPSIFYTWCTEWGLESRTFTYVGVPTELNSPLNQHGLPRNSICVNMCLRMFLLKQRKKTRARARAKGSNFDYNSLCVNCGSHRDLLRLNSVNILIIIFASELWLRRYV